MTFPMLNDATALDEREDAIQARAEQVTQEMWDGLDDQLFGQAIGRALEVDDRELTHAIREACLRRSVVGLQYAVERAVREEAWAYAEAEMGGPY